MIRLSLIFALIVQTVDCGFLYRGIESYMSDISLERFYIMEENVMSSADALLRKDFFGSEEEETAEEHEKHALNMTEMENILARAKDLHREVGPDLWNFLGHPVNLIHLFRRLNNEWKQALDLLLKSSPCKLWKVRAMSNYLKYLREIMPNLEDTRLVVNHMIRLQEILGTPTREVANGMLGNTPAREPLSADEQFLIGKILFEAEKTSGALTWFEIVNDWLKDAKREEKAGLSFNETDLYEMMATSYYVEGKIDKAVEITDQRLNLDRTNERVLHNLNFFKSKQSHQQDADEPRAKRQSTTINGRKTNYERICAGHSFKLSRKRCYLEPVFGSSGWYVYKKEALRHKPSIMIYHDVITKFTMEQLKDYARHKLSNKAWITPTYFGTPEMSQEIKYTELPQKKSVRFSVQKAGHAFAKLQRPNSHLLAGWGTMQIMNVGRTGVKFSEYTHELQLKPLTGEKVVGAMFGFLSEPMEGGEVVMKGRNVFSPIPKGSILKYFTSQTKPHALCPSLGGSQWVIVQPFVEREPNMCPPRK